MNTILVIELTPFEIEALRVCRVDIGAGSDDVPEYRRFADISENMRRYDAMDRMNRLGLVDSRWEITPSGLAWLSTNGVTW